MPTIESEWAEFAAELLGDAPPDVLEKFRYVFFAGFFSMLTMAFELNTMSVSPRRRLEAMKKLYDEHELSLATSQEHTHVVDPQAN